MDGVSTTPRSGHDPPLVLLVDDDVDTRDMYGLFLRGCGFAVEHAGNAEEALAAARTTLPDVVIADIRLRGMDGFALCREMRRDERMSRIPVIALSGYSSPTRVEEAERAGFDAFLLKPCLPENLLQEIRARIAGTRAVCASSRELRATSETLRGETRRVRKALSDTMTRCARTPTDSPTDGEAGN